MVAASAAARLCSQTPTLAARTMTKPHRRPRKRPRGDTAAENDDDDDEALLLTAAAAVFPLPAATAAAGSSHSGPARPPPPRAKDPPLPPPFPLAIPPSLTGFLSNRDARHRDLYRTAMETSYEGVAWEPNVFPEPRLRRALDVLNGAGFFRVDVTQPAGLGARCAPTFVTRCLLGAPGMTYRYLGLRMFAHPWDPPPRGDDVDDAGGYSCEVADALRTVAALNRALTERTEGHLKALAARRAAGGRPLPRGRAGFDVALMNRMTHLPRLKEEPMFGRAKCTVSWHADSSLEHYSTIAVYQTILDDGDAPSSTRTSADDNDGAGWSVALRVAHNAEGPKAARLGSITVDPRTPPVRLYLPSGSAYYLLDDANHHLQHAVLAPSSKEHAGTRYSSTHRLLREGAQVSSMIRRCGEVCQKFAHHGPKRWRVEQLVLDELEGEWLRQFFVQGQGHKRLLWPSWGGPIGQLFKYWSKLETRTFQIVALLRGAARRKCGVSDTEDDRQAFVTVEEVYRSHSAAFDKFAQFLVDRARTRSLWRERELDPAFKRVDYDSKPLPFPVEYNRRNGKVRSDTEYLGVSPFADGSPEYLERIADLIRTWGAAYATGDAARLPAEDPIQLSDGKCVQLNFDVIPIVLAKKNKGKKKKRRRYDNGNASTP